MSKKVELLLDEPCPELLCGICSDVLDDPIQVHCPEDHMFCGKCIHHHVDNASTTCAICTTTLDKNSFQSSKFVSRQVGRLRIKCPFYNHGCPWQGIISDNHMAECTYKPINCPNTENGCTANNLNSLNVDQHLSECLYQNTMCPNNMPLCQPYLRRDQSIHDNNCASYTCPYSTEGCPYIGTHNAMIIHRDGYCGRLHKKIQDLEEECKRLNSLIHDFTIGLNIKLPSTPSTTTATTTTTTTTTTNTVTAMDTSNTPSMDNEMALFHEMFNSDPFGSLDLNSSGEKSSNTPVTTTTTTTPMDLLSSTDLANFLSKNNNNEQVTSPQPLQFIPPVTVPKRTSNGKKIRYSKNVRLAHSAIRIARQRTASNTTMNPSNDAILNNLDIAKQKLQQQQLQQQPVTFKNLDDVTHFLNNNNSTEEETVKMSRSTSSNTQKEKKRNNSITSTSSVTSASAAKSPMQISAASPPANMSNSLPKRRPMFILASSYLSNYNSANSPPPPSKQ